MLADLLHIHEKQENEKQVLETSRAIQSIPQTRGFRKVSLFLLLLLAVIISCLILVPWQQSISGVGRVAVFSPMDRPQSIEAPFNARINHWQVREGQRVKSGQVLLTVSEIDPKYLDPDQLERLEMQRDALLARRDAAQARIASLQSQASYLQRSRSAAVPSARAKTLQALNKIDAAQQALTAARQNQTTAELNLTRIRELHQRGLRSTRDLELAEQSQVEAATRVDQAIASLEVARQDQNVAGFDQVKVNADTAATLSSAQAAIANAYETLASTNSDLAKLEVEIQNLRQRVSQRNIRAPRDGIVVRILQAGPGETVSEGDVLASLVPEKADQAVELLISDNDAPLVSVGRPVRLQFSGWPALQFSGWPAVAVGTFAGRVKVIDAVDDGTSRYRVWVEPDFEAIRAGKEQAWPSSQYLRPGSEAVGWIMLDNVPLWFEMWRQFNAFPPTVSMPALTDKQSELKKMPETSVKKPKKK